MPWTAIRLELAPTTGYPQGSANRAYLLRLPLDAAGLIDAGELERSPRSASVRRFWPNEPDLSGYATRTPEGWAFSYETGGEEDGTVFPFAGDPIRIGEQLLLTEPDGRRLPFRVASLSPID